MAAFADLGGLIAPVQSYRHFLLSSIKHFIDKFFLHKGDDGKATAEVKLLIYSVDKTACAACAPGFGYVGVFKCAPRQERLDLMRPLCEQLLRCHNAGRLFPHQLWWYSVRSCQYDA